MLLRRLISSSARLRAVKSPLTDVALPAVSLQEYVWENVHQWPDKIATECGVTGRRYKYGELRNLCRRFATSLRRAGLQPGNTLSIVMPNTAEWPLVFLGAVEAGLVITTANPAYTAEELARQFKDCETHGLVTISSLYSVVQKAFTLSGRQSKPLVMISPGLESDSSVPPGTVKLQDMLENNSDILDLKFSGNVHDTLVLPYSSGTTGLPKGVMLSHWNIVSNCIQMNTNPEICNTEPATGSHQDVLPAILPLFHAYGMVVLMLCKMAHGAKLVTLPKFDPTLFYSVLDRHQATTLLLVPPIILFLASHPGMKPKYLESWRHILCGAAPIGRLDVERFLERAPTVNFMQGYGMTELGPVVSCSRIGCKKYESVGIPIPNTEMKTIDVETGQELPLGKVGEVCARGPQVMKGYFNRPDATKETIRDDGWLHTGDLGYYDDEGCFYVVDRLKELIKVKGYQVAPAELEEVLRNHPDVLDAAVIGVQHEKSGEVPRAFIVKKRPTLKEEDIQKYMSNKVSAHKQLKGGIEFLDAIPKAASGKILRRLLKQSK